MEGPYLRVEICVRVVADLGSSTSQRATAFSIESLARGFFLTHHVLYQGMESSSNNAFLDLWGRLLLWRRTPIAALAHFRLFGACFARVPAVSHRETRFPRLSFNNPIKWAMGAVVRHPGFHPPNLAIRPFRRPKGSHIATSLLAVRVGPFKRSCELGLRGTNRWVQHTPSICLLAHWKTVPYL